MTASPSPRPLRVGDSGIALNYRGFRLLQAGDARAALPVLESAVAALHGSSSITEAYASYNLAAARFALGRCDVVRLLDRSEQIQGHRRRSTDSASRPRGAARTPPMEIRNGR